MTAEYTIAELMTAVMCRDLRDGEVAIMGAVSAIPMTACRLAQQSHAPNLWYIAGGSGAVNPHLRPLVASSCDQRLLDADMVMPLPEVVLLEGRGDVIGTFFAGGLQIDQYGNCNLIAVGDWHKPALRGPGTVGLPFLLRAGRVFLYTQAHTPRTFVERVDFRSGQGFLDGPEQWRGGGYTGGPALVVTNLCVFDFHPQTLRMRLRSVHPGVSVEQVLAATGFRPELPEQVAVTEPPTGDELNLMRKIDALGLLQV